MDLHGIDLNLLVAFDALMAERSVTRAGARIGRTQPAMSAALARLRGLMKDELFIRGPNGLQPTPLALDLAQPIAQALTGLQRALEFTQTFDPSTSTASFTLGLSDHPTFALLPSLLGVLRERAPGITLRIRNFIARDDAIGMLDAGEVDLTVGVPPSSTARIVSRPLFEERFVCVVRKGHPTVHPPLDLHGFLEQSHLLVSPENENYGVVDAALARQGLKRRLALTLPQLYAAPALVAQTDLIATLMEGVVAASGHAERLCIMPAPLDLPPILFALSWHRRNDVHPAQRWLRDLLASVPHRAGLRLPAAA
ncbi:DNA-binding transcriptional LysR family regulator [Azospirillum lipoferum]|uniref:LysR family transcriptional regulator n=1 Tax=Azospirillum lipoferum TaxID=193 RepID=A0A5A9GLX1_AZOLI|nr:MULTISPECIES: LysR family transcriptional regulator [Azospirillum]KAA0595460.1 LysR family transcriptional regulator [Azospirillum lipoferum]MCP1611629.1 DNA-binding transcriptional LysR family regulator [Azospirillum lipoferum]MDW5533612.1 LysR family transcriptional regulator [Azospirillum sp. NL1]